MWSGRSILLTVLDFIWLWSWWLPHKLSKRQWLSTTVLFTELRSPGRSNSTYFCVSFLLFYQLALRIQPSPWGETAVFAVYHFFSSFQTRWWSDAAKSWIQGCTCFPTYLHMILVAMENLNLFVTEGTGMSSMWVNKWSESEIFRGRGFPMSIECK